MPDRQRMIPEHNVDLLIHLLNAYLHFLLTAIRWTAFEPILYYPKAARSYAILHQQPLRHRMPLDSV